MKLLFAKGWKKAELWIDLFIKEKRVLKDYTKITLREFCFICSGLLYPLKFKYSILNSFMLFGCTHLLMQLTIFILVNNDHELIMQSI